MRIPRLLLGAAIALSVLAPIAPIPAHANYIEIVNGEVTLGIGMPHFTAGTFDLADPAWSFENDPNWRAEIVPCPLVPWILGQYIAWETTYHPSTPPIIDPVVAAVDPIGLPSSVASETAIPDPMPGGGGTPTSATAVPEPSTWAMLLLGFAGLGYAGFRRSKAPIGAFD